MNYFEMSIFAEEKQRHVRRYREDWRMKCPFYRKESPTEIKCAGIVGTHTTNTFRTKEEKREHKYDFCNGNFFACPLYQAIDDNTG